MKIADLPVMDRRDLSPAIVSAQGDWSPPRIRMKVQGVHVACPGDRPVYTVDQFIAKGSAWYSSNRYSGQAANDNIDWPLGKLLKTEGLDYHLTLAERYRDMYDVAMAPFELRGTEPNDLYMLEDYDNDGKRKGVKKLTGKKANVASAPTRKVLPGDGTKRLSAPVPKKWNGDWPLIAKIDAGRDLAYLRGKLGFVPKILDAFEWAVIDGRTLAEIGKALGAGIKGGKGEARARIFDGFDIVDRYWKGGCRKVSTPTVCWAPGTPVPGGYYRSPLHPGAIFLKGQLAA